MTSLEALSAESFCYLTTTARITGRPHQIEIWFALRGRRLYLMAGGRYDADWVRNLRKQPRVRVRIASTTFDATATVVTDPAEDALARRLILAKYANADDDLDDWGRTALPRSHRSRPLTPLTLNDRPHTPSSAILTATARLIWPTLH